VKQPQTSRKRRLLAFLPAALVIGVVAATAAGMSLITSADASTVVVTGTVDATLDIPASSTDPTNTGLGGTCSTAAGNATFAIAAGWETAAKVTGDCAINFGSSNGAVQLTFENGYAGTYFYCNHPGGGARSCAAGMDRVGNVAAGAALGADSFGIALNSVSANAAQPASGVTKDANDDALAADTNTWYPIPDSGSPAEFCHSLAAGTAQCVIRMGVQGKGAAPAQNPGHYDGLLQLTAAQI
jgi:hypothetical protein